MIESSSKRLTRIKKKLKKNDTADYHFLIGSMERETNKQNYQSNTIKLNKTSLKNNVQLIKPSMISSFDNYKQISGQYGENNQCTKIKMKNSGMPFFQNVKFLKNSRIQVEQPQNQHPICKQSYNKSKELSIKRNGKEPKKIEVNGANVLNKSVQVSNFSSYNSKTLNRDLQRSMNLRQNIDKHEYKNIIEQLSQQNSKLSQLISEHEKKNIKMFIKMNDNESKQIQNCKKYLSTLYDKYKLLQKSILKENKRCKQLSQEKINLERKIINLQKENQEISEELLKLKEVLWQYTNQTQSKLSFEEQSSKTIFNFSLNEPHTKDKIKRPNNNDTISVCQSSKIGRSFVTKRDKASSCLSNHQNGLLRIKQDETMSCSTITKTKNMKKKKQKIPIGINLKDQFNEIYEDQNKLKNQIQTLKNKLNVEIVQKLARTNQVLVLSKNLQRKDEKLARRQQIINQQLEQIKKLMQANLKLANFSKSIKPREEPNGQQNIKHASNCKVPQNCTKKVDNSSKQSCIGKQKPSFSKDNCMSELIKIQDISFLLDKSQAEYRIIALQAAALQKMIGSS